MTTFLIQSSYTRRTIAQIDHIPFFDTWVCSPSWCDMSKRTSPVDGYAFKAPGEYVSVHRGDLHDALLRLAEDGETTISINGIRYLRRLRDEPLRPPQNMQPLPIGGGLFIGGRAMEVPPDAHP